MFGNGFGHGCHILEDLAGIFGIADLKLVLLVKSHDQLEGVHRIQTKAVRSEQRLLVADLFRGDLQHEVFDHQSLNL